MRESREEINQVLAMMGEPPLNGNDVVGEPVVHVHGNGEAPPPEILEQLQNMQSHDPADIKLPEPPGHRRSEVYFLNGRHILVDLQLEQLLERVYRFQDGELLRWWQAPLSWLGGRRRRFASYLELPQIDLVGDQQAQVPPVAVANPARFSRKSIDTIQSMSRAWLKMVPGQLSSTSTAPKNGKGKLQVVSGADASLTLEHLNRKQRRELARNMPRG